MSIIRKLQPRKTVVLVLIVCVLAVSFSGCLEQTCSYCNGRGTVTQACAQCGGSGIISRELRYQVIDSSVSEGGILDWKAWLTVTIRNLDDKTGYFTVTGTASGGGKTVTATTGAYIGPGAVEDVVIELDIELGQEYNYNYRVVPETIEVTCPGCGGTGRVTVTCPECGGTGKVSGF